MNDVELQELWKIHAPYIYARCYKLLRDKAAAEDATQETFLRVQLHLDRVPCDSSEALAWIYRVAINYCRNEIRNRGRRPEPRAELPERPESGGVVAPDRFDRAEENLANRQLARRLIDRTSVKLTRVAWLYHVDGMGQQEVADTLGISRRTVVARLAKFAGSSRQLLRKLG
jgi:RNA polymerase sigma-70 factor (ECF subfamily)